MTHPESAQSDTSSDDTARILAESASRLFEQACPPASVRRAESDPSVVAGLWEQLDALGLPLACASETAGGSGLGWSAIVGLLEACGEHAVPAALPEMLAAHLIAREAALSVPAGVRLTLAQARREADDIVAQAVPGVLAGIRVLVQVDDRILLLSADDARAVPGANAAGEPRIDLVWAGAAASLALGASAAPGRVLLAGAAIRTAQIAGASRKALALSVGYANDRAQFGKPIGKFQAIQQQLAVAAEWGAMATMAARLAMTDPGAHLDTDRVAACREVACSAAAQVAEVAHAVHGAIGVTLEYDLQLVTRRLKSWACEFGSSRHWTGVLGRRLVEAGSVTAWDRVVALTTLPEPVN